jgi:branched-subunit amino acid transport protein
VAFAPGARASLPVRLAVAPFLQLSLENEQLLAGAVAIAVAWRTRLTFATIISGLVAFTSSHG